MKRKPRVYIANHSMHTLANAADYGDIVIVTRGHQKLFAVSSMARQWMDKLKDSEPYDCLIFTSTNVLCSVGAAIFAAMHGRLNILVYKKGKYYRRDLDVATLIKSYTDKEALDASKE